MSILQSIDGICTIFEAHLTQHASAGPGPLDGASSDQLFRSLTEACQLLRDASPEHPELYIVTDRVNSAINKATCLLRDASSTEETQYHLAQLTSCTNAAVFEESPRPTLSKEPPRPFARCQPRPHDPWTTTPRPHNLSTTLSRFNWDLPCPSQSSAVANAVLQARCEIWSDTRKCLSTAIKTTEHCVLISSGTGWRFYDPALTYYLLDGHDADFPDVATDARVMLKGGCDVKDDYHDIAIDEVNKMILFASGDRIQSFVWGDVESGATYTWAQEECTLISPDHRGPMSVFAPARILRAGTGSIAFWNIEISEGDPNDVMMDGVEFEDQVDADATSNAGSEPTVSYDPTTLITLADPDFEPATWHIHPNLSGSMLCAPTVLRYPGEDGLVVPSDYSCVALDLDSAKVAARYLGHSDAVRQFSTSPGDPQTFLTAGSDGYVRLYDTRMPLPGISIATDAMAAVFIHPDGAPLVFTGSGSDQVIRLWDLRTAKMVYELSTGNNDVTALAWDARRNHLYATTRCEHLDRNGEARSGFYRAVEVQGEFVLREDAEDAYEQDLVVWPSDAAHGEDYFGHLFDAAGHRIFRYAFKDFADPTVLPVSGHVDTRDI
ncbi:hypothetical protein C8R46DRAFT_1358155 [Mycena filopes]|nr:hypothetical protein C8R46DRAFT_1358155 [Mycena filopes]